MNQPIKEEKKIIPLKKSEPVVSGNTAVASTPQVEVKPKKQVQVVAKGTPNLKSRHLSISSVLSPDNKEDDDFTNTENKPRTEFDYDLVKGAIRKLASRFQQEGKDSLASTIVNGKLTLEENFILHFQVGSTIQRNALEKYRNDIVSFLRKTLQNWGIDISYEVIKSEKSNDIRLMTSVDKFKLMSEKNPDLLNLQKTFKLDIDF